MGSHIKFVGAKTGDKEERHVGDQVIFYRKHPAFSGKGIRF